MKVTLAKIWFSELMPIQICRGKTVRGWLKPPPPPPPPFGIRKVICCTSSGIINYTNLAFKCHIIGHLFLEFGRLTFLEPIYSLFTSLVSGSFNLKRLIFIYSLQWFWFFKFLWAKFVSSEHISFQRNSNLIEISNFVMGILKTEKN